MSVRYIDAAPHSRRRVTQRAFTLIELLVVISIIALLISILLPALGRAREQGKTAVCISNLRSILQSTQMYMDNDDQRLIPWYTSGHQGYPGGVRTPWVFGGFQAPARNISWLYPLGPPDSSSYPAQVRPLNRYIATDAQRDNEIGVYQDPGDRTWEVGFVGSPGAASVDDDGYSAWQVWGSSYTLNTRFMQGPSAPGRDLRDAVPLHRPPPQRGQGLPIHHVDRDRILLPVQQCPPHPARQHG